MKNLTKKDLARRFDSSSISPLIIKKDLDKSEYKYVGDLPLTKYWKMVIPGSPISDSRPRHTAIVTYNPHKAILEKIIKEVELRCDAKYKNSVCIKSPFYIELRAYVCPTNVMKNHIKKDFPLMYEALKKGTLPAPHFQDNDNFEKVHWDCLQSNFTILKDDYAIKNNTEKWYIMDKDKERVEIEIYYTDMNGAFWEDKTLSDKAYLNYIISPRYKIHKNIPDKKWKTYFYSAIADFFMTHKSKNSTKGVKQYISKKFTSEDSSLLSSASNHEKRIEDICNNIDKLVNKIISKR